MKNIQIWRLRHRYRRLLRLIRSIRQEPSYRANASALLHDLDELRRAMGCAELALAPIPVRSRH